MSIELKDRLNVMITEYKTLREEMAESSKHIFELIGIALGSIGVIVGFALQSTPQVLSIVPFVSIVLAYRFAWDLESCLVLSKYLYDLEESINGLQKGVELKMLGWQECWYRHHSFRTGSWLITMAILFGGPTVSVVGYYVFFYSPLDIFKAVAVTYIFGIGFLCWRGLELYDIWKQQMAQIISSKSTESKREFVELKRITWKKLIVLLFVGLLLLVLELINLFHAIMNDQFVAGLLAISATLVLISLYSLISEGRHASEAKT